MLCAFFDIRMIVTQEKQKHFHNGHVYFQFLSLIKISFPFFLMLYYFVCVEFKKMIIEAKLIRYLEWHSSLMT